MAKKSQSRLDSAFLSLARWFEAGRRVLPWREDPSLYRVWISEIMLQQTQVATVVPYFERFLERFPTVEHLAQATEEDVLMAWAGLGYYSRARNLRRAAQAIVARGDFPRTREHWLEIPGVGNYTAGAILSIALDQPEAILDGNVERVLSRVRRVSRVRGDAAFKARLWRLSREAVLQAETLKVRPSCFNQAMMELGATVCSVRNPGCGRCPIATACKAFQAGVPEQYPPRKKAKAWVQVKEEVHCVWDGGERVLLSQRATGQWRAGLWDLLEEKPRGRSLQHQGVLESRYVVTRHKVTRKIHVWLAGGTVKLWRASDSGGERWIHALAPEVPLGSPVRKILSQIIEKYSGTRV